VSKASWHLGERLHGVPRAPNLAASVSASVNIVWDGRFESRG